MKTTKSEISQRFAGVFTALITPFLKSAVDFPSLGRLVDAQIKGGIQGFVINGTTAESPTLSENERTEIFKFVRSKVGPGFPLVMGTGSNSTAETIKNTKQASAMGADAALVVVPYYNKPPQRGLFQHFQQVAECSTLPVILYNVPSRTITALAEDTIAELSRLPNVIGIKEASGDIAFAHRLRNTCEADFLLTSGDDGTFLDFLSAGGGGIISVAAHILPAQFTAWHWRMAQGDHEARADFAKYADLISYLYVEANPIGVKAALHLMGLINSPELRLPMVSLQEPATTELRALMKKADLC